MANKNDPAQRRVFINKFLIASASLVLSPSITRAFKFDRSKIRPTSQYFVDPMTAMMIAKTSLDLISSFTGSKDSGIAAMMRHQTALLENISQQIDKIQFKLVEIQNAIDSLPLEVKVALSDQFKMELLSEIRGAVLRFNNDFLIPCRADPNIVNNADVRDEVNNIIFVADQKICTLNQTKVGIGPEACMIAPLAMSVTIAGKTSLRYPRSTIVATLWRYYNWFEEMQSSQKGSIRDVMNQVAQKQDSYLAALDSCFRDGHHTTW